ncbi:MAG: hypothetical protein IJT83_10850 [Victivallales bacterium]|nr:hypothetical protein [Victivallales bacterium]
MAILFLTLHCLFADELVSPGFYFHHGVSQVEPILFNSSESAFLAPMPERMDSVEHQFIAAYLVAGETCRELFSGYSREIAETMGTYSRTPCRSIAANHSFTSFAIIHEVMLTGTTPPGDDVTIPYNMGVFVTVVNRDGEKLWQARLKEAEATKASQLKAFFTNDSRLIVHGPTIGTRLYNQGGNFTEIPLGECRGQVAFSSATNELFFLGLDSDAVYTLFAYNLHSGETTSTGLTVLPTVADAMPVVSNDGKTLLYISSPNDVSLARKMDDKWTSLIHRAPSVSALCISENGGFASWQASEGNETCFCLYDTTSNESATIYVAMDSAILPTLSTDGFSILYLAPDANGTLQLWQCKEIGNSCCISLKHGWNMLATPFTLDDDSKKLLHESIESLFSWQGNVFVALSEWPGAGKGCYVNSSVDTQIRLSGHLAKATSLQPGWNLISPQSYQPLPQSTLLFSFQESTASYVIQRNTTPVGKANWLFLP